MGAMLAPDKSPTGLSRTFTPAIGSPCSSVTKTVSEARPSIWRGASRRRPGEKATTADPMAHSATGAGGRGGCAQAANGRHRNRRGRKRMGRRSWANERNIKANTGNVGEVSALVVPRCSLPSSGSFCCKLPQAAPQQQSPLCGGTQALDELFPDLRGSGCLRGRSLPA